jgi:DNA-directed RNA polymerase subunit RPC12/RpoP
MSLPVQPSSLAVPPPAAPARPAASVRLPLQIGTSSLWSLSRGAATLLPGLSLVIGALPLMTVGSIYATAVAAVVGGLLVYFAGMHLLIAARSRPSDVILGADGLLVEGGVHHGRAIAWAQIDPERTTLTVEKERRYTLLRIFGNGLAVLLMLLVRRKVFWIERAEFDIARLRLGLRDGSELLLAEAERPIEKESLEALHDAVRSSGWHGPAVVRRPKKPDGRHTTMGISVLFCHRCGAVAIPDDKEAVACRYCNAPVPIPPATRERIAADLKVRAGRTTSDRLVGKLLQQPGAGPAGTRLLVAAIVMMVAWPVSFVLGGVEIAARFADALSLFSLLLFPVATILGLFFLLRASLADRFALRLLTLDFGAQHPRKDGDPYTCRRCDAPLPDEPGAVVVGCRYCGAENILGLDLRRDAVKATREASSLEDALQKRAQERRLWGALTVVAVMLVVLGVGALAQGASAMIDLGPTPAKKGAKPAPRPAAKPRPAPRR